MMLTLAQSEHDQDVTVESKEIPLNFDTRVAQGLVVTVRTPERTDAPEESKNRVTVQLASQALHDYAEEMLEQVAKSELRMLEEKRKRFPRSDILLNYVASVYLYIGDKQAAIQLLSEGLQESRSNVLKHKLARALIEDGKLDAADRILDDLGDEWELSSLLNKAYISVHRQDIPKAKQFISAAIQLDFFDYSARLFAGAVLIWDGAYQEAIRCFKIASEERPRSSIPLVHMGAAYFALGQTHKAINVLRKAVYLNPLDDRATSFYSDLLLLSGRPELAIAALEKIYEVWGDNARPGVLDRLTKAYLDCSEHRKAVQILQQRLLGDPQNPALLNNAGLVLWKKGDSASAQKFLSKASESILESSSPISPKKALPVTNFLTLLLQAENYSLAVRYGKQLLDKLPLDCDIGLREEALVRYVEGLAGIGKEREAAEIAETAIAQLGSTHPSVFKLMLSLLIYYSVIVPNKQKVQTLSLEALSGAKRGDVPKELQVRCANNAIFALLQVDQLRQASVHLHLLSSHVLKDPYVTATLGLYYIKKHNVTKGKALYEDSIRLARDKRLKSRLRQRMALELAKEYVHHSEDKEALYWVQRAMNERVGFKYAYAEALELKRELLKKTLH